MIIVYLKSIQERILVEIMLLPLNQYLRITNKKSSRTQM